MNTKHLLDQLFQSGNDLLQTKSSGISNNSGSSSKVTELMSGKSGAALAGGALGLLLGSKKGGKVLSYGGVAALGAIAYKAYSNWQQQQDNSSQQTEPKTINRIPATQVEQHSRSILCAIVGAAKADGHIDDREREIIDNEMASLISNYELLSWFDAELKKPLDPAEIASNASTPEIAAEMYLASLLVIDEESFMERSYLAELARQLKLPPALKAELEQQAKQAAQT